MVANLLVANGLKQVLNLFHVTRVDHIASADLAAAVVVDGQQLLRIGAADVAVLGHRRPKRFEHAGGQRAQSGIAKEFAPAVAAVKAPDMHDEGVPV